MSVPLQADAYSLDTLEIAISRAVNHLRTNKSPNRNAGIDEPIWFRGHEKSSYTLIPGLYRHKASDPVPTYDDIRLAEESRMQHFSAKAYRYIDDKPSTNIEWQEIMQHYQVKTRLMDWSENLYNAALFALEPFISNPLSDAYRFKRKKSSPTIWLLNPAKLNEVVFDEIISLIDTSNILDRALDFRWLSASSAKKMFADTITKMTAKDIFLFKDNDRKSGIISLSRLEDIYVKLSDRLSPAIDQNEFNLFWFLVLRIYSDGMHVSKRLPPVAVVHPHHSLRIERQSGVFTVHPYPPVYDKNTIVRKDEKEPFTLENCPRADEYLYEIRLHNYEKIANDLRSRGFGRTSIYPELTEYGQAIEWR